MVLPYTGVNVGKCSNTLQANLTTCLLITFAKHFKTSSNKKMLFVEHTCVTMGNGSNLRLDPDHTRLSAPDKHIVFNMSQGCL